MAADGIVRGLEKRKPEQGNRFKGGIADGGEFIDGHQSR